MSLTAFKKWKGGRGSAQLQTPLNTIFGFQERRSQSTDSIEIGPGHRPRSQTDPLENNLAPPLFVVRITKEIDEVADQDLQPLYKELGLDAFHKDANDLVFGKEGEVVAGTSKRLIEHMVDEKPQDKPYIKTFLCTHRYIVPSKGLFERLIKIFLTGGLTNFEFDLVKYEASVPEQERTDKMSKLARFQHSIRLRVLNVFRCWVENYSSDFEDEAEEPLLDFINMLESKGGQECEWGKFVHWVQIQATRKTELLRTPRWLCPTPIIPSNLASSAPIIFLKVHPLEIARQLTLMEFKLFKAIRLKEYQQTAWGRDPESTPNVQAFIRRFNQVSFWVASEIFSTPDPKNRVLLICRFIELARHLRDLNNFNGMMEIIAALNGNFLQRLRQAWKVLPQKHLEIWEDLGKIVDPIGSYRNYRKTLRATKPPLIPFQGVYLTDLTFIEQNADKTENGLHNFEKMEMISKVCLEVKRFQSVPYMLDSVNFIQDYLSNPKILSEDELWACSKLCAESYEPPPGGEAIAIFEEVQDPLTPTTKKRNKEGRLSASSSSSTSSSSSSSKRKEQENTLCLIRNPIYGIWIDFQNLKFYTHRIPPSAAGQGSTRVNRLFMSSSSGLFQEMD